MIFYWNNIPLAFSVSNCIFANIATSKIYPDDGANISSSKKYGNMYLTLTPVFINK